MAHLLRQTCSQTLHHDLTISLSRQFKVRYLRQIIPPSHVFNVHKYSQCGKGLSTKILDPSQPRPHGSIRADILLLSLAGQNYANLKTAAVLFCLSEKWMLK